MKKVLILLLSCLAVFALFFFVMSCSQQAGPSQGELNNAEAKASEATQKVVDLLAENDNEALADYLATEDPSGEVAALVDSYKLEQAMAAKDTTGVTFDPADYENGDVLVFQGSGESWQGNLMSLILVGTFGHAGVLDKDLADDIEGNASVLSATIDYDEETGTWINGLCLQDPYELAAGSVAIGRFAAVSTDASIMAAYLLASEEWMASNPSLYAFLHLNLDPVSRDDDLLWYCSKVPWRFYNDNFGVNVEDAEFYFEDGKWQAFQDTAFYKIYYALLRRFLPARWATYLANRKLKKVLRELITPDELWYWAVNNNMNYSWTGNLTDYWAGW